MSTFVMGKKKTSLMMILMFLIYFTSYITRNNFSAVLEGIRQAEGYTKEALGVVTAISFVTYGAGQLISGFLGDRIQPKALLVSGLLLSCVMNFLIPFMPNTTMMCVLWGINGFAQAFMWPPLVKLMAGLFEKEKYDRAVVYASWGGMIGTIANYLLSFLFVSILSWRFVFYFSSVFGVMMATVIFTTCPNVSLAPNLKKIKEATSNTVDVKNNGKWFSIVVLVVMICIVLQGSLRDGIATWMPTFIDNEFNLGDGVSILTGALMPILGIVSFVIASKIHATKFKNPLTCTAVIFVPATICAIVLIIPAVFKVDIGAIPTIIAMALLNGCTHGINMMLVCMVPKHFVYTGKVSLISGVLNAFTYIGSAVSIYGYPIIQDSLGLDAVKIVWVITAVLAMTLCFVVAKPFSKKYM